MGGCGSGRHWHLGAKETVDDYRELDVRHLQKSRLLTAGEAYTLSWTRGGEKSGSIRIHVYDDRIIVSYRHQALGSDWESLEYPIHLSWTACHFGGQRPWFKCPAKGCDRRVAKLYGGRIFACRHCFDLAYQSQRECYGDRMTRHADKIRERLGWMPGILNPKGTKPKGMHWSTFERLESEHDYYVKKSCAAIEEKLNFSGISIDDYY